MNFATFPYLVFLLLSVFLYFTLSKNYRHIFLLLASYLFYAFFSFGFVCLLIFTTLVTFISARYCYRAKTKKKQLFFFLAGLLLDLTVFILFKYIHIIDIDIMNWPGLSAEKFLVPIGISFYTFKTVGYCVDIYKRKYEPETSFVHYALAVGFFPQLIAGPIEKAVVISKQFKQRAKFNSGNFIEGGKLILWGLFKKLVIADSIAQIINPVFSNIENYKGLDLVIALFAFTYQVYTDFSGYSDIAIGSARCFGIYLPANFNKPFFSRNFMEFWKRWHITLYKWVKEYIYDQLLGGTDRKSILKTTLKVGAVFILIGLWHGATLNYLFYAGTAFIWVLIDFFTREPRSRLFQTLGLKNDGIIIRSLSYLAIISMISSFEIFFKGSTLAYSFYIFKNIFSPHFYHLSGSLVLLLAGIILFFEFLQSFQQTADGHCFEGLKNFYLRAGVYTLIICMLILLSSRPDITFQYYQF